MRRQFTSLCTFNNFSIQHPITMISNKILKQYGVCSCDGTAASYMEQIAHGITESSGTIHKACTRAHYMTATGKWEEAVCRVAQTESARSRVDFMLAVPTRDMPATAFRTS